MIREDGAHFWSNCQPISVGSKKRVHKEDKVHKGPSYLQYFEWSLRLRLKIHYPPAQKGEWKERKLITLNNEGQPDLAVSGTFELEREHKHVFYVLLAAYSLFYCYL